MPEINQISRDNVVATTTDFIDCPETYFNVKEQHFDNVITLHIEGRLNAAGGGGGRFRFTGPVGAVIQGHADVDNGQPQYFNAFEVAFGGAGLGNGNHKFKIFAVIQIGQNTGKVQLQIALNSAQGNLTMGRTQILAMKESADFE